MGKVVDSNSQKAAAQGKNNNSDAKDKKKGRWGRYFLGSIIPQTKEIDVGDIDKEPTAPTRKPMTRDGVEAVIDDGDTDAVVAALQEDRIEQPGGYRAAAVQGLPEDLRHGLTEALHRRRKRQKIFAEVAKYVPPVILISGLVLAGVNAGAIGMAVVLSAVWTLAIAPLMKRTNERGWADVSLNLPEQAGELFRRLSYEKQEEAPLLYRAGRHRRVPPRLRLVVNNEGQRGQNTDERAESEAAELEAAQREIEGQDTSA